VAAAPSSSRVWPAKAPERAVLNNPAGNSYLRGQPGIGIDPSASRGTEACLGGGSLACVGSAEVHVQSHLLVRDVIAGTGLIHPLIFVGT
jgi:hypothetical protein